MTTPATEPGLETLDVDTSGPRPVVALEEQAPRELGRYRILEQIGSGGMGVVYAAWDPELERELAIKLMKPERQSSKFHARLLREAKALAKLSHPNVVAVHDVGTHGDRPFIVMDLVEGGPLTRWLRRQPREWPEIVKMFAEAGAGIAAAHEIGLVHRDFKTENVLVGNDGRPRVVDFGLVRTIDEPLVLVASDQVARTQELTENQSLTRTGAVMGTPGYMAPEQVFLNKADARSDQFAFCVALWEGLFGERPFAGMTAKEIGRNAHLGNIKDPPAGSQVPGWLRKVLRRGLAADPDVRWPSMKVLLAQLRRRRAKAGTVTALAVGTGLVAAGLATAYKLNDARAWIYPVELPLLVGDADLVEPMVLGEDEVVGPYAMSKVANQGRLTFTVDVPIHGTYYLWGLVWEDFLGGDRGDADSFFVYVDNGEEHLWHFGCQNEQDAPHVLDGHWSWQPIRNMPNADSDCVIDPDLRWELEAGEHSVVVRNREDGTPSAARVAQLVLTNDGSWTPPVSRKHD